MSIVQLLLIVALLGGVVGYIETGKRNAVKVAFAEQLAADNKREAEETKKVLDYEQKLSKERADENQKIKARAVFAESKLAALAKAKPEVAAWLAGRVPAGIDQLQHDSTGEATGSVFKPGNAGTNSSSAGALPDQRGLATGKQPAPISAGAVQPGQEASTGNQQVPEPATKSILERINKMIGK